MTEYREILRLYSQGVVDNSLQPVHIEYGERSFVLVWDATELFARRNAR
jgi:hypothetical protein